MFGQSSYEYCKSARQYSLLIFLVITEYTNRKNLSIWAIIKNFFIIFFTFANLLYFRIIPQYKQKIFFLIFAFYLLFFLILIIHALFINYFHFYG
jgi:hypothetical protein